MEEAAQSFIGKQGWIFVAGILAIVFNGLISGSAKGMMIFFSRQYQPDDIVILNGRRARIVRVGMMETVFYFEDASTKLTVPNESVKGLGIEKEIKPMKMGKDE